MILNESTTQFPLPTPAPMVSVVHPIRPQPYQTTTSYSYTPSYNLYENIPKTSPSIIVHRPKNVLLGSRLATEDHFYGNLDIIHEPPTNLTAPIVDTYVPIGPFANPELGDIIQDSMGKGNYEIEAQILRNALENNDNLSIIDLIAQTNTNERLLIRKTYTKIYGENLLKKLNNETIGDFNTCVIGAFMSPGEYDAFCLYKAMKGIGTNEGVLSEIIGSRTPYELRNIKNIYKLNYGESLEEAIIGDTSGDYQKLLLTLLQGNRSQNEIPNNFECKNEAEILYRAGEGKLGTDEATFIRVFGTRSREELILINSYYRAQTGKGLLGAVDAEFSGDLKELLDTTIYALVDPPSYFAERIHDSVAGAGTNDSRLIRNILSRNEKDMPLIMLKYKEKYGNDLINDVNSDTSGDYRKVLNALLLGYSNNQINNFDGTKNYNGYEKYNSGFELGESNIYDKNNGYNMGMYNTINEPNMQYGGYGGVYGNNHNNYNRLTYSQRAMRQYGNQLGGYGNTSVHSIYY